MEMAAEGRDRLNYTHLELAEGRSRLNYTQLAMDWTWTNVPRSSARLKMSEK